MERASTAGSAPGGVASVASGTPPQIFISYARRDQRYANLVEASLTAWNCRSWIDRQQLAGGQSWTAGLEQAIAQSAALILVLTPSALASPMVQRELAQARDLRLPIFAMRFRKGCPAPDAISLTQIIEVPTALSNFGALYVALDGLRLIPPAYDPTIETTSAALVGSVGFPCQESRAPADWRIVQIPRRSYLWRAIRDLVPVAAVVCVFLAIAIVAQVMGQSFVERNFGVLQTVAVAALALLFVALFRVRRVAFYLYIFTGRVWPETFVMTPRGCLTILLRASTSNLSLSGRLFQYENATSARIERGRWNRLAILFTGAAGPTATLAIPTFWPDRDAIAQQILADAQAVQSKLLAQEASAQAAHVQAQSAQTVAPTVSAPTFYAMLAPRSSAAVVVRVQEWLGMRGLRPAEMVWMPEGMLAPTALGAEQCRCVFFADTPSVTNNARFGAILRDLQRQGKLLIPLRMERGAATPNEWSSLQWIDCSPAVSHQRSLSELCDTLDRNGLLLAPYPTAPMPSIDTELTLARAYSQRAPADWRVFQPTVATLRASYRIGWMTRLAMTILLLVITGGVIQAIAGNPMTPTSPQISLASAIIADALMLVLTLGGIGAMWYRALRPGGRARTLRDLLRGYSLPECLVIVPAGIAFHLITARRRRFDRRWSRDPFLPQQRPGFVLHGSILFADLLAVELSQRVGREGSLRLRLRDGSAFDLPLGSLTTSGLFAAPDIAGALASYRANAARDAGLDEAGAGRR